MSASDAARLEAAGIPLRIGERDVRVRFTFRSMKMLEERYGDLSKVNEQLRRLILADHPTPHTEMLSMIEAGLLHEPTAFADVLDSPPHRFGDFREALIGAINEGFPDVGKAEEEGGQGDHSPGTTSTTSPPSDGAELVASSGT